MARNRPGRKAFSLVEVVVALGVFSFCVVAIVSLLVVALESSRQSQQDSAMAAILQNTVSKMGTLPASILTNLASTNFYYDLGGSMTATPGDQVFRATVNRVSGSTVSSLTGVANGSLTSPGATNSANYFMWMLQVSSPAPAYTQTNNFLIGRTLMGAAIDNFRE